MKIWNSYPVSNENKGKLGISNSPLPSFPKVMSLKTEGSIPGIQVSLLTLMRPTLKICSIQGRACGDMFSRHWMESLSLRHFPRTLHCIAQTHQRQAAVPVGEIPISVCWEELGGQ